MVYDEKLKKVCSDFSLLNGDQQEYILGILQALVFAKNIGDNSEGEKAASAEGSQKVSA